MTTEEKNEYPYTYFKESTGNDFIVFIDIHGNEHEKIIPKTGIARKFFCEGKLQDIADMFNREYSEEGQRLAIYIDDCREKARNRYQQKHERTRFKDSRCEMHYMDGNDYSPFYCEKSIERLNGTTSWNDKDEIEKLNGKITRMTMEEYKRLRK